MIIIMIGVSFSIFHVPCYDILLNLCQKLYALILFREASVDEPTYDLSSDIMHMHLVVSIEATINRMLLVVCLA
jgi:hypothetical protein